MDTESAPTPRWVYCDECLCVRCGTGMYAIEEIAALAGSGVTMQTDAEGYWLCPRSDCNGHLRAWPRRGTMPARVCHQCGRDGHSPTPPTVLVPVDDEADVPTMTLVNRILRGIRACIRGGSHV